MGNVDLSELEELKTRVLEELHGVKIDQEDPESDGEPYHITFFYRGTEVEVDWLPSTGFEVCGEEKPDVFPKVDDCARDIISRLNE